MAEIMKPGIKWQPEVLQQAISDPVIEEILEDVRGYAWAIDPVSGKLRWAETGSVAELSHAARLHIKEDPTVFIRVVKGDSASQEFFRRAVRLYNDISMMDIKS